jgi:heme/copper-type cytochrome/quinol oxidase subunit 2
MLYNNEVFSARIVPLFLIEGRQWKWEYRYNVASLLEHGAIQKSVGNGVSARGVSLNPLEVNIFKKKAVSLLGQELAEQGLRVKSELLKSKGSGVSLWDLSFNFFTVSGNSNFGRATAGVSGDLFNRFRVSENTRRLLTANRSLALPDTALTKALITGCDVIHSWTLPGLGVRIDAVPGKVYALKVPFKYYGVFNGQCSEVCGLRHAYMPIAVNFVTYSFFIKIIYMHFFASVDFFVRSYLSTLEANSKKDHLPWGHLALPGKDAAYAEQAAVTDFIYGEYVSTPQ